MDDSTAPVWTLISDGFDSEMGSWAPRVFKRNLNRSNKMYQWMN